MANGERPELFGDGTQTRDFTHVDDVVRACELAADNELQGIYHAGTAESWPFDTMVEKINAEPTYIENPFETYVHGTMADYSKLHDATGWEPEIDFEEGIACVCEPSQCRSLPTR